MPENPNVAEPLKIKITSDIDRSDEKINKVTTALEGLKTSVNDLGAVNRALNELSNNLSKLGTTNFTKTTQSVNQYANAMNKSAKETQGFGKSVTGTLDSLRIFRARMIAAVFAGRLLAKRFVDVMDKSNMYIENVNLFTVTMGRATQSALDYAEAVSEAVGIDPGEWIKHQGVFKQIASGFGVAEDRANLMAKNLTQLTYDTTSFFNTTIESAAQRFEAAMAQQSRPLRRFGYDISMTALREEALAMGIEKTVDTMSRAEKAQLTYMVLMKQSGKIMGDMARTVITPANALRILNMQFDITKRAIGNILIPIVQAALPYLMAFAQALRHVAAGLAALTGFEFPPIDYSRMRTKPVIDLADAFDGVEDSVVRAGSAIKEFKNFVLGFDELHIIPSQAGGGGGGGVVPSGFEDIFANIDLPEYDFLEQLAASDGKIARIRDKIIKFLDGIATAIRIFGSVIEGVGALIATMLAGKIIRNAAKWFITTFSKKTGETLQGSLKSFDDKILGTTLIVGGIALGFIGEMKAIERYRMGKINSLEYVMATLGTVLGSVGLITGGLKLLGVGLGTAFGVGAVIGIVATAIGAIAGYLKSIREEQKEILKQKFFETAFGDLELTVRDIQILAGYLLDTPFHQAMKLYIRLETTVDELADMINVSLEDLKTTRFHIAMGLDISPEEHKSAIMDLITSLQKFLKEDSQKVLIAIDLVFGEDSETGSFLSKGYSAWNLEKNLELKTLTTKITEVFEEAIKEGFTAMKTEEMLAPLYEQLNALIAEIDRYEKIGDRYRIRAEYGVDLRDITPEQLTAESHSQLRQEVRTQLQSELDAWAGVVGDNTKAAVVAIEREYGTLTQAQQDAVYAMVKENSLLSLAENFEYFSVIFKQIRGAVDVIFEDDVVKGRRDKITKDREQLENLQKEYDALSDWERYAFGSTYVKDIGLLQQSIDKQAEQLAEFVMPMWEGDEKLGIEGVKLDVELSKQYYKKFKEAGIKMGKEELDGYIAGLELGALALDDYAVEFFEGRSLFSRPEALEDLLHAHGYGAEQSEAFADGIFSNSELVYKQGQDTMFKYFDGMRHRQVAMTPELYSNLKALGYGMTLETELAILEQLYGGKEKFDIYNQLLGLFKLNQNDISTPEDVLSAIKSGMFNKTQYENIKNLLKLMFPGSDISDDFVADFMVGLGNLKQASKTVSDEIKRYFRMEGQSFQVTSHGGNISYKPIHTAYATGGFPTAGELFIANEAGPEMVGKMGNRNVVASNLQIIEGISQGVIEGMLTAAAITGSGKEEGSSDTIIVQVGDEVILEQTLAEIKRKGQRSGKAVMVMR